MLSIIALSITAAIPIADTVLSCSLNTSVPINVATTGSMVAVMFALLASIYLSPQVKQVYGITLVTSARRLVTDDF